MQHVIEIKGDNALQESKAGINLQNLANRLGAKGINKLMEMYESAGKKILVEGFLKANGI